MAHRAGSFWGSNPYLGVSLIEDRLRAMIGVAALIAGFAIQGIAYAVTVSVDDPAQGNVCGVIVSAAVPAALVLGIARAALPRYRRRGAVQLAGADMEHPDRPNLPSGKCLLGLGTAIGYEPLPDESNDAYALRVFGVAETRERRGATAGQQNTPEQPETDRPETPESGADRG